MMNDKDKEYLYLGQCHCEAEAALDRAYEEYAAKVRKMESSVENRKDVERDALTASLVYDAYETSCGIADHARRRKVVSDALSLFARALDEIVSDNNEKEIGL